MIDRKTVIKAFEIECNYLERMIGDATHCDTYNNTKHLLNAYKYTIDMLTEQRPVYSRQMKHFVCPSCSLVLDEGRDDYCPQCGKKIAWDETDE